MLKVQLADNLDVASEIQQQYNDLALQEVRRRLRPEHHPDFDGVHCVDCSSDLPMLRLEMGKVRCVYCQEACDRRKKLYGSA